MDYLPLIGIAVVAAGFACRLRISVTVLAAGFVTGLVAGMPIVGTDASPGIVDTLGRAFTNGRAITLFVLALPAIGLSERFGLQEQARRAMKIPAATVGRLQLAYQCFRIAVVALGIRLGSGHVVFSKPIVVPMSLAIAGDDDADLVKAASAASENYGNFFGQNLFFGAAGVALVVTTLKQQGRIADPRQIARWTIPVAVASLIVAAFQYWMLDRMLRKRAATRKPARS